MMGPGLLIDSVTDWAAQHTTVGSANAGMVSGFDNQ
jgi:hypothetical protein